MDLLLLPLLNAKNPFKTDIYECLCMTQVNDLQILKAAFIVNQSLDKEECIKGMFYIMFVKRKSRVKYCSFHLLTQEVISCV